MSTVTGPAPALSVEHPRLVPALLLDDSPSAADADGHGRRGGRVQRSVRDWLVDVTAFLLSVSVGLLVVAEAAAQPAPPPDALLVADLLLGSLGCLALWWRRRWPVGVALLLAVLGTFADMVAAAGLISLFTVAVHRRWPDVLLVTAASLATFPVYLAVRPISDDLALWLFVVMCVALTAAVVAWGMFVRARRQLVLSLRERAVRAETEQLLRVEQAQQLERTRIAREMHDVLAHRLSLLSMHAGALEFRPDAPPAEVARAAGVVRASAHQALEDLREVVGVLREAPETAVPDRPQPTLDDVPDLLAECRQAGLRVLAEYRVPASPMPPPVTGRTAYRVVQEALTNVRKHAPGAAAVVRLTGAPGVGLSVEVRNPAPVGDRAHTALPSSGTGLVGLAERVTLAGGRLEHGWTAEGDFRLCARLPWPAERGTA